VLLNTSQYSDWSINRLSRFIDQSQYSQYIAGVNMLKTHFCAILYLCICVYWCHSPFDIPCMSSPACHQISEVQVQVSQNTEALQGAQMEISDLSRQLQTLEIELASQQSLVSGRFESCTHVVTSQFTLSNSFLIVIYKYITITKK